MTKGFFYVATGKKFIEETLNSVRSLRAVMPDAQVTLYTDLVDEIPAGLFSEVRELLDPIHSFRDKVIPIMDPPYDRVVFLDTDTHIMEPLDELFDMLDQFEFAAVHAPNRAWKGYEYGVPQCFSEMNSGVLIYRKCEPVRKMMEEWFTLYEKQLAKHGPKSPDQPPLRAVLYRSNVKSTILPPEYNTRLIFPVGLGSMPAKILHGRGAPLWLAKRTVNRSLRPRTVDPYFWSLPLRIIYKLRGIKNV